MLVFNAMTIKSHIKHTLELAYPVSIGYLGQVMLGVVDSLMIGQVGAVPLAASSLVNSLLILILVLGIGMSVAVTPLVAIARGSKNADECGVILRQALLVNSVFSILLMLATFFTADLLTLMNQPEDVVELAESYMKIVSISILPFMIFQTYKQFIEGLGDTKPGMFVNIAANIVNVFGNWVLIYGNLGFPRLELDGAGIASTLTRIFTAIAIFYYVTRSKRYREYDPSLKFKSVNLPIIKKIIGVGAPTGLQMFFEIGGFSFAAIMIGWMGATALAAHQIAISLASITFMITLGISVAATITVGHEYGKKNFKELRRSGFSSIALGAGLMTTFGIIFIIFKDVLPTFYVSDEDVILLASNLLIVAAFFQIFDGIQVVGLGVLRGLTDVKLPMIISLIAYWVIGIPLGYYLGFILELGAVGVWISLSVGLITAAVFFTLRFHFHSKRINNTLRE